MIKDTIDEYNKLRKKVVRIIAECKNYIIDYTDILSLSTSDDTMFVYYICFEEDGKTFYYHFSFSLEWLDLSDEDLKKAVNIEKEKHKERLLYGG